MLLIAKKIKGKVSVLLILVPAVFLAQSTHCTEKGLLHMHTQAKMEYTGQRCYFCIIDQQSGQLH